MFSKVRGWGIKEWGTFFGILAALIAILAWLGLQAPWPSRRIQTAYLADLPHVGGAEPDAVKINREKYDRSVWQFSEPSRATQDQYDLKRACDRLDYTAGVTDDSPKDAIIEFKVFGDDTLLRSHRLRYGEDRKETVSVSNVEQPKAREHSDYVLDLLRGLG